MVLGLTQALMGIFLWGGGGRRFGNLTNFMCDCLEVSTSWNPQGLSRAVKGLLYTLVRTTRFIYCCGLSSALSPFPLPVFYLAKIFAKPFANHIFTLNFI